MLDRVGKDGYSNGSYAQSFECKKNRKLNIFSIYNINQPRCENLLCRVAQTFKRLTTLLS